MWIFPRNPEDRTLVVLQLGGGNDGLNTRHPAYKDPMYQQLRPTIGQKVSDVLPISDSLAMHPGLKPLVDIFNKGKLAVVEGVEYPTPNFSHFRGTEIWMTGDDQNVGSLGWLGHALDHLSNHPALVAASLGVTTPRALVGMQPTDIALGGSLKDFVYKPVGKIDPGAVSAIYDYMNSEHDRRREIRQTDHLEPRDCARRNGGRREGRGELHSGGQVSDNATRRGSANGRADDQWRRRRARALSRDGWLRYPLERTRDT